MNTETNFDATCYAMSQEALAMFVNFCCVNRKYDQYYHTAYRILCVKDRVLGL